MGILAIFSVVTALLGGIVADAAGEPVARVSIGAQSGFVASGGGSIWTTDHAREAVRIDPGTNAVTARVRVGVEPLAVVAAAGSIWVANRGGQTVSRINPATNKVAARIRVGRAPYGIAAGAGAIWVSNESDGTVSRINPKRNKAVATIRVGIQPNGLTVAAGAVWVSDLFRGRVIRISPVRNRVTARIVVPKPDWFSFAAGSLWVSSETGKIFRVNPKTRKVMTSVRVGRNPLGSAVVGGLLWVPNIDDDTISVVDPLRNAVTRTISSGDGPLALVSAVGSVWVSHESGEVWRFPPQG